MNYIRTEEFAAYGISDLSEGVVRNACSVIDAFLSRPEGLLYTEDDNGLPLFMTKKGAEGTFKVMNALSAGKDIPATLAQGPLLSVGSSLVLDRKGSSPETVFVKSVQDSTHVILDSVVSPRASGIYAESGMCTEVSLRVPKDRHFVTFPSGPLKRIVSAFGRVGYSRRGDTRGMMSAQGYGIVTSMAQFGGAPSWNPIPFSASDIDLENNQLWTPTGMMMSSYTNVRVAYIAGYTLDNIPSPIKTSVATLARAISQSPASSSVSLFKAGETQMERFVASILDDDIRAMLQPFRAAVYG